MKTAYEACRKGGCTPAVLNAANEIAVESFLNDRLKFPQISEVVAETIERLEYKEDTDFETILSADAMAREESARVVQNMTENPAADYSRSADNTERL